MKEYMLPLLALCVAIYWDFFHKDKKQEEIDELKNDIKELKKRS